MATSAERQRAYRARLAMAEDHGKRQRLQTWVTTAAGLALEDLSRHHGLTKCEMLERLTVEAQRTLVPVAVSPPANPANLEAQRHKSEKLQRLRALAELEPPAHDCARRRAILAARAELEAGSGS